jgi:hypothetical protein
VAKALPIIFRPLERWPRDMTDFIERKRSPFKTRFEKTIILLRAELRHLSAPSGVIQAAFEERHIDSSSGMFRADRKPLHPGVVVAADTRHGAQKWVCDDCDKWTDNVHAIVLTLQRLRLADLYGVPKKGEQYAGWKMLPGPITLGPAAAPGMSIDQAARLMASATDFPADKILRSSSVWQSAYREAARKHHPDRGGNASEWKNLQDAAQLLNMLHNK